MVDLAEYARSISSREISCYEESIIRNLVPVIIKNLEKISIVYSTSPLNKIVCNYLSMNYQLDCL